MIDTITFEYKDGSRVSGDVTVYALSTCGHCKRALRFLDDNSIKYRYIFMDLIPSEEKNKIKEYLAKISKLYVTFPFMVVDDTSFLAGFIEDEWRRMLKLEQ